MWRRWQQRIERLRTWRGKILNNMFKLVFLPHASLRMKERGVSREIVEEALATPDKIEKSKIDRSRFLVKKLYFNEELKARHLLLIVVEREKGWIKIVTVVDTSKINKYF